MGRKQAGAGGESSAAGAWHDDDNKAIIEEVRRLYTDKENGLIPMYKMLGKERLPPRQSIQVLLVGNHSAGKSSFINWYCEEKVQKAGVALETSGFTFVTNGKKKETLTGEATIRLYPHMKGLGECAGVSNCIRTEIVTSAAKEFPMITMIDTPGLIEGRPNYPYDIDAALLWLARSADLVLVMLDPMGQALCKHLLDITEKMCNDPDSSYSKIHFYLSKADTAGSNTDRQKVITQMAKDLYGDPSRPGMSKLGAHAELPTIFIPQDGKDGKASDCPNDINEICNLMEKTIKTTVQDTMNKLQRDSEEMVVLITDRLAEDDQAFTDNWNARFKGIFFMWIGLVLPLILLTIAGIIAAGEEKLKDVMSADMAALLTKIGGAVYWVYDLIPADQRFTVNCSAFLVALVTFWYGKRVWKIKPRLSSEDKEKLKQNKVYVSEDLITRGETLYKAYLEGTVGQNSKI